MWCKSGILFHNCPFYFFLLVIVEKIGHQTKNSQGLRRKVFLILLFLLLLSLFLLHLFLLLVLLLVLLLLLLRWPCGHVHPVASLRRYWTCWSLLVSFSFLFFWARPLITFDGRVTLVLTWCLTSVPVMHCSSPQQKDLKERFILRSFLVVLPWGRILKAFTTRFFHFSFLVTTAQSELLMNC